MRITRLTLPSPDPARLLRFYGGLGFHTDPGSVDEPASIEIGRTTLWVVDGPAQVGAHHLALTIPSPSLAPARQLLASLTELRRRDATDTFHFDPPFGPADSVYADDPDGLLLELIARDLPGHGDFDAARDVRGVGEVAVPVDSVPAAVEQLRQARGLVPVIDGPEFAAVGDHEGMFILVEPNRTWFPTLDLLPNPTPLEIEIDVAGDPVRFSNGSTLV